MSSSSLASDVARMLAGVRPWARSFFIVARLVVSFVCDESIREIRLWYARSPGGASAAIASDPIESTTAVRSCRSSTTRS